LFTFDDDVGPGLPLWLPNGTVLIEELEKLAKETEFAAGYDRVRTPHLARESLYITSGHLPYYAESMFPPMLLENETTRIFLAMWPSVAEGAGMSPEKAEELKNRQLQSDRYYLKAMNCPHHHKLFAAVPRSYRDLPLRLAEYGTCYRYEQSGELFGLMRVRSMQMNDAHIYCTEEQFEAEFNAVNQMYLKYFQIFGIEKYLMRFSTHDPAKLGQKFVNEPELWAKTEEMVRGVLQRSGINFIEVANEAAFYGPKIDVQVWSAIGREFTIATNQVDFAVPRRFGLVYKTRENTEATPLCIHRAPLGTHERFIGFLIEHYAGNFPFWLAPYQVRILPIGDEAPLIDYAQSILAELRAAGIRAGLDGSTDKINGKVLRAEEQKVHTMLVLGRRDLEAGAVSVRVHGKGNLGARPRAEVIADLITAAQTRRA
jgi:threonyl-tRNA synthetase